MFIYEEVKPKYVSMKKRSILLIVAATMLILFGCGSTQQKVVNEGYLFSEEDASGEKLAEQCTEYSMEEIKELLFGEWEVSKLLGFSEVQNDYTNYSDGHDIIGNHILMNESVFSSEGLEKYERYQSEVLEPSYEVSDIKERYLIYYMNESIKEDSELYDMIVNDELQEVKIRGKRDGINGKPPAVEIMISSNKQLIILTMDGAFYLLKEVGDCETSLQS